MYRHSESTGAQSENLKNSPTYYIVSGGFDPIHTFAIVFSSIRSVFCFF